MRPSTEGVDLDISLSTKSKCIDENWRSCGDGRRGRMTSRNKRKQYAGKGEEGRITRNTEREKRHSHTLTHTHIHAHAHIHTYKHTRRVPYMRL